MKNIFMSILMGLFVVVIFTGCTSQTEDSDSASYRQEFTDSELEEGHAEFDIVEHLSIEADITPMEKYKDGLNSYYQVGFMDSGDVADADSFAENTTIFGHEQDEFFTLLEELFGVSVNMETMDFIDVTLYGATLLADCQTGKQNMSMVITWDTMCGAYGTSAYGPSLRMPWDAMNISYYASGIQAWLRSGYEELDFGDSDEIAETYLSGLEELTGRKLSDTYDCITLSEETLSQLSSMMDIDTDLEESYYFFFYYDIDGLPVDYMVIWHELEENESCTDLLALTTPDESNMVYTVTEWPLEVAVSEDGVSYLEFDNFRDKGEIYKESLDILTPTDILEKIVSYYDTKLLLDDMIITDMRLIYNSGFTDGEDDLIDSIFCPMWKVTVYDCEAEQNKVFLYDAETGEAYYEAYELYA